MEVADPQESVATPVEAKPAPSFARLTDLMDGSPLKSGSGQDETSNEGLQEDKADKNATPGKDKSRNRHKSHEPEYNPWDA